MPTRPRFGAALLVLAATLLVPSAARADDRAEQLYRDGKRADRDAVDLYAVGKLGTILRSTGAAWTREETETAEDLHGVWGSGPDDLYAVGSGGVILHSTGDGHWTLQDSGTHSALYAVWGRGRDDVYAVGPSSIVHRSASKPH